MCETRGVEGRGKRNWARHGRMSLAVARAGKERDSNMPEIQSTVCMLRGFSHLVPVPSFVKRHVRDRTHRTIYRIISYKREK